ncbi:orexigenic neuropeptide QRFP [Tachyglossus aculeatus]|uniref:orexigenic neuropeptide QRFP n=1 Tax=Tachyglossus aculeatus TaxID=9261 RepID=UPI0018F5EB41|nr:orexigenic neuropeptide QRFP [Tachyglossus aculeatus]
MKAPFSLPCLLLLLTLDAQKKDPKSLFGRAKEPQGFDKERASFGFRFGRQEEESPGACFVPASGEKQSGLLGNLAEELNGYHRKKGGFSLSFGRCHPCSNITELRRMVGHE